MSSEQFIEWWNDLKLRFPSVRAWIAKHAPDQSQQQAMLRTWRSVLGSVELDDCLAVNAKMQCGDLPFVGEYEGDKEWLPMHVRDLARRMASDRKPASPAEEFAPATSKQGGFPGAKILRRLWELRDQGMIHEEAREVALRELPVGQSPFREPRYNCPQCHDTGRVLVATNEAIIAELQGRFAECHHRNGLMKCSCRGYQSADPKRPLQVYDATLDFKIEDTLWREPEVQRFSEWVKWQHEHRAAETMKRRENYESSFNDWNQREYAP